MIEVIATLLRWLQLASNMILVGGCVFLAIAGSFHSPWVTRLQRALPWLGLHPAASGLLGILATTTAQATGISENAWRPDAWLALMQEYPHGAHLDGRGPSWPSWSLAIALYMRYIPRARWKYLLCATVASAHPDGGLACQPFRGRRTLGAVDPALRLAHHPGQRLVWRPARLPRRLLCLHRTRQPRNEPAHPGLQTEAIAAHPRPVPIARRSGARRRPGAQAFLRHGPAGHAGASLPPASSSPTAWSTPATARLVATRYGWLLDAKIAPAGRRAGDCRARALHLAAAACPSAPRLGPERPGRRTTLRKWVSFEFVLAMGIVLLATIVANTVPAKHALIQNWPYSFRFSLAATWGDPDRHDCASGAGWRCLLLAMARRRPSDAAGTGTGSGASGMPAAAGGCRLGGGPAARWPSMPIRKPIARPRCPFDTISIANGSALFAENCVACHGPQGKGDGVMAKSFAKPPVDMLTEPHTAKHTAGDFFHWLTFGIPDTGMPVFADKLSRRRPLGRGQLPARHVARLPGAPDESHASSPSSPSLHGPAQFLLHRARRLKRHPQGFPRPEERPAGPVLLAAIARAPGSNCKASIPELDPGQHRAAGRAGR